MAERIFNEPPIDAQPAGGFHFRTGERVSLRELKKNTFDSRASSRKGSWALSESQSHTANPYAGQFTPENAGYPRQALPERHKLLEKTRKGIKALGWTAVVAGLVAGGGAIVYATNPGDVQHAVPGALGLSGAQLVDNGISLHPQQTNTPDTLNAALCTLNTSLFGVASVDLAYPEVPLLTDKDHSKPYIGAPYLLDSNETKSQQSQLEKFNTVSGYPELTLNSMPLGITICDLGGGITRQGTTNVYHIDVSKLRVRFEGPGSATMLSATINPVPQTSGINQEKGLKSDKNYLTGINVNPKKGEWLTYPVFAKADQGGIDPSTSKPLDPTKYASVNTFQSQMQAGSTVNTLMALAEDSFIKQISKSSNNLANVSYDDRSKNTTDYLTNLILERLGADKIKSSVIGTAFKFEMDQPVDKTSTTKQPITVNKSITSMYLFQQARVNRVTFQSGYPNIASSSPIATPRATPTPTDLP